MAVRGWTKHDVRCLTKLMQEYGEENVSLVMTRGGKALQGRSSSEISEMWKALKLSGMASMPKESLPPHRAFCPTLRKRKASEARPTVNRLNRLKEPEEYIPGSEEGEEEVIWISSGSESSCSPNGGSDSEDRSGDSRSSYDYSDSSRRSRSNSGTCSSGSYSSSGSQEVSGSSEVVIDLVSISSGDSSLDNKEASVSGSGSTYSSSSGTEKGADSNSDADSNSEDASRGRTKRPRKEATKEEEQEGENKMDSRPGSENKSAKAKDAEIATAPPSPPFLSPREKLKQQKEYQESDMEEWKRRQEVIRQQSEKAKARRKRIKEENLRVEKRLQELKSEREKGEKELYEANRIRPSIRKKIQHRLNGTTYFPSVARKLGLTSSLKPTRVEMTKVYKKAILKYHPDRTSKNFSLIEKVTHEEIFKVLQTSFQTYK